MSHEEIIVGPTAKPTREQRLNTDGDPSREPVGGTARQADRGHGAKAHSWDGDEQPGVAGTE